ncbi:MAG: DnaD domain protein [Caldilineaceae bacterium]
MAVQLNAFIGFPDAKLKPIAIPELFFVDLLPQIDNLAELKLTLHCFWLLNNQEGDVRYLRGEDLRNDPALLQSLGSETDLRAPRHLLEDALGRAVARNTLLKLEVEVEAEKEGQENNPQPAIRNSQFVWQDWYFMNTAKGRQTIQLIREGKLPELLVSIPDEARLRVKRPTVFVIYEQNIGLLTPLIADQLRDMEKSYPPDWISEAFETAVRNNKRNLRYIQNILKRWETEGKGNRENTIPTTEEQRRRQYIPDEFSDIILR